MPHPWAHHLPKNAVLMKRASGAPASARTPAPAQASDASLADIRADLGECTRCKLCKTRTNIVFGDGSPKTRVVFVGEGPGDQEDQQGLPFVGRSGQLLTQMIQAMGLAREQIYIANVVKCRPPDNRNPEPDEVAACSPFLHRQLDLIKPQVVVALGKFAAQTLLATETPISKLRGTFHDYRGTKLMPTFHPAYLLRNPPAKKDAWADLLLVMKELGLKAPARAN